MSRLDTHAINDLVVRKLGVENRMANEVIARAIKRRYDQDKLASRLREVISNKSVCVALAETVVRRMKDSDRNGATDAKRKRFAEANGEDIKPKIDDASIAEQTMREAQRLIEQRKKELNLPTAPQLGSIPKFIGNKPIDAAEAEKFMKMSMDNEARRAQLKAKIGNRLQNLSLPGIVNKIDTSKLTLDSEMKLVDTGTGQTVRLSEAKPDLEANKAAKRRDAFYKAQAEARAEMSTASYIDPRIEAKPATRSRRGFKFHEKGEIEAVANRERIKARLEKLQSEIASTSKKTGISSAVKLAVVAPKTAQVTETEIPHIEWWDQAIVPEGTAYDEESVTRADYSRSTVISNLIEHPIQLKPPNEPHEDRAVRVYLTKKEQKKLRRQNRREILKEKAERVRLGLEKPPEPKMKMSNLMRVLGTEAIQNPTKMEQKVRAQIAERLQKHKEANEARKLTKEQRVEKAQKKLSDEGIVGVHVAVFRINDLSSPKHKFKVEKNAQQLKMTGVVVLSKDTNVVVVEGSQKQLAFYKRLMLHRIKWNEGLKKDKEAKEEEDGEPPKPNECALVWEGIVKKRNFGDVKFKQCPLPKQAAELFERHNVPEYWDMALTGTVLADELNADVRTI